MEDIPRTHEGIYNFIQYITFKLRTGKLIINNILFQTSKPRFEKFNRRRKNYPRSRLIRALVLAKAVILIVRFMMEVVARASMRAMSLQLLQMMRWMMKKKMLDSPKNAQDWERRLRYLMMLHRY